MAATYLVIDINENKITKAITLDVDLGCKHITRRKLRFVHRGEVIDLCKSCLHDLIDVINKEILA